MTADQPTPCADAPAIDPMRRCTATTRSGAQCRSYAIVGAVVCRMHGGAAPQVRRAAAERERAARQQSEIAAAVSLSVDAWRGRHPIESVEDARATASAMVEEVRSRLAESDFDVPDPPEGGGGERSAPLRQSITMELLRQWTDLAGKLGKASLDAGTEERKVRIDEAQGAALVASFRRFEAAMLAVVVEAVEGAAGGDAASVLAAVRSAWSSALPSVVRAAIDVDAIDGGAA